VGTGDRLRRLDNRLLGDPNPPPPNRPLTRMERIWERPWGWVVPFGAPWKLGRRHAAQPPASSGWVLLIWGVWSERVYNRARARSIAEQNRG
jgi:hypothetical protein